MSEDKYLYAFDLSLDCSGLTIFNLTIMEHVLTTSFPMKKDVSKQVKLKSLEVEISKLMKKYPPHEVALESVFISVGGNQYAVANKAKAAEALYNCHGMLYTLLWSVPLFLYAPTSIKKLVAGHGQSDKSKVQQSIKLKYPHMKFNNSDESDSYAVCISHLVSEHGFEWERPIVEKQQKKSTRSKSTKPKTK